MNRNRLSHGHQPAGHHVSAQVCALHPKNEALGSKPSDVPLAQDEDVHTSHTQHTRSRPKQSPLKGARDTEKSPGTENPPEPNLHPSLLEWRSRPGGRHANWGKDPRDARRPKHRKNSKRRERRKRNEKHPRKFDATLGYPGEGPTIAETDTLAICAEFEFCQIKHWHPKTKGAGKGGGEKGKKEKAAKGAMRRIIEKSKAFVCKELPTQCNRPHYHDVRDVHDEIPGILNQQSDQSNFDNQNNTAVMASTLTVADIHDISKFAGVDLDELANSASLEAMQAILQTGITVGASPLPEPVENVIQTIANKIDDDEDEDEDDEDSDDAVIIEMKNFLGFDDLSESDSSDSSSSELPLLLPNDAKFAEIPVAKPAQLPENQQPLIVPVAYPANWPPKHKHDHLIDNPLLEVHDEGDDADSSSSSSDTDDESEEPEEAEEAVVEDLGDEPDPFRLESRLIYIDGPESYKTFFEFVGSLFAQLIPGGRKIQTVEDQSALIDTHYQSYDQIKSTRRWLRRTKETKRSRSKWRNHANGVNHVQGFNQVMDVEIFPELLSYLSKDVSLFTRRTTTEKGASNYSFLSGVDRKIAEHPDFARYTEVSLQATKMTAIYYFQNLARHDQTRLLGAAAMGSYFRGTRLSPPPTGEDLTK